MKKKNGEDKRGSTYTEIENLKELIEREGASVGILLQAASGDSTVETDDVCLFMRDCSDRVEKMEESLERLEGLVR